MIKNMTETQYKNKHQKENYDRIIVEVDKGDKEKIDTYRKEKGYKSLNYYIKTLIKKDMAENPPGGGI